MSTVGTGPDMQQVWGTVMRLGVFVADGDVQGLRAAVEEIGARLPNYWQEAGSLRLALPQHASRPSR